MFKDYTQAELESLITNRVEENLNLDYKGADALYNIDGKIDRSLEISKDVSSFANSDGGIIIY